MIPGTLDLSDGIIQEDSVQRNDPAWPGRGFWNPQWIPAKPPDATAGAKYVRQWNACTTRARQ